MLPLELWWLYLHWLWFTTTNYGWTWRTSPSCRSNRGSLPLEILVALWEMFAYNPSILAMWIFSQVAVRCSIL